MKLNPFRKPKWHKAYSFGLITFVFFLFSWIGQFVFQLMEAKNEAETHGQSFSMGDFWPRFLGATFENWQSEFLQLIWQAAGLTLLYFWGSSQSRESDDRLEAKVDALLTSNGINPQSVGDGQDD